MRTGAKVAAFCIAGFVVLGTGCSQIINAYTHDSDKASIMEQGLTDSSGNTVVTSYLDKVGSDFAYFNVRAQSANTGTTGTSAATIGFDHVAVAVTGGLLSSYERRIATTVPADGAVHKVPVEIVQAPEKGAIYQGLLGTTAQTKTGTSGTETPTTAAEQCAELKTRYGGVYRRVMASAEISGNDTAGKRKTVSGEIPVDLGFSCQ